MAAASNGAPEGLGSAEVERYSRQLLLPSFGIGCQRRLKKSRILIVGVGGLGCPAALFVAGAGVGTLGLVDIPGEAVAASNLHRQIAHTTAGATGAVSKVDSARRAVQALNPLVSVAIHESFAPRNAVSLARIYDVVLDCTDNVATRYLVSDACAAANVPLVSGAALGLDGQLTVLCAGAPCYRCVFPSAPPPACVGSCDAAGVLGPIPGTIGTLMALEAIKVAARMGAPVEPLCGRLLLFDGARSEFRTVGLRPRSPTCRGCGDEQRIDVASFDYGGFAGAPSAAKRVLDDDYRISVEQFARMCEGRGAGEDDFVVLDVRPASQFRMCSLGASRSVPLEALDDKVVGELAEARKRVVVLCRRGNRSQTACRRLLDGGVQDAVDVRGGLQAWHHQVDSSFPLY